MMAAACTWTVCVVTSSAQEPGKMPPQVDQSQSYQLADSVNLLVASQAVGGTPSSITSTSLTASSNLLARSSAQTGMRVVAQSFAGIMTYDANLSPNISLLLAQQTAPARPEANPVRFGVIKSLVTTLCATSPPLKLQELKAIYDQSDLATDRAQLYENEQLSRIIHSAFVHNGMAAEFDYQRSASYKRIVRRRAYLTDHPDEERRP